MSDKEISSSSIASWLVLGLGTICLGILAYEGNKIGGDTDKIPVIEAAVQIQQTDIQGMKTQISDVPLIKLQMEYITKQLEHINSSQDESNRAIEENRNKLADHERRIQQLELIRHR